MNKENYQEKIDELNTDVLDLIEGCRDIIPPYEVGCALIRQAVSMLWCTAPNHKVALKTILACIEIGIEDYTEIHEEKQENEDE